MVVTGKKKEFNLTCYAWIIKDNEHVGVKSSEDGNEQACLGLDVIIGSQRLSSFAYGVTRRRFDPRRFEVGEAMKPDEGIED